MKRVLKALANSLAQVLILPAVLLYWLGGLVLGPGEVFPGWSQTVSLFPGLAGVYLRRAFYKITLPRCGEDSFIGFGTVFSHHTAEVGRKVYVGTYCCLGDVVLEDDVLLGSQVSIVNGGAQHGIERLDIPIREQPGVWPRITIGCDTWIGDRAVVLADVGSHCVIGGGSVVTKPIPDYAIAVGLPAKVIRFRNQSEPSAQGNEVLLPSGSA
jgi:virginiamycin A acetyltransferase